MSQAFLTEERNQAIGCIPFFKSYFGYFLLTLSGFDHVYQEFIQPPLCMECMLETTYQEYHPPFFL